MRVRNPYGGSIKLTGTKTRWLAPPAASGDNLAEPDHNQVLRILTRVKPIILRDNFDVSLYYDNTRSYR
jgi:hypothetical protein